MNLTQIKLENIERSLAPWIERNALTLLRISIGIVFVWFGTLKFFPGLSPAQDLAINTITLLTFGIVPPTAIILGLALWEVLIGLGFLTGKFMKAGIVLLLAQMTGTFAPIFFFPEEVFTKIPYGLTLEGQYIFKNIIIISAALVLGSRIFKKPSYKGQTQDNMAK